MNDSKQLLRGQIRGVDVLIEGNLAITLYNKGYYGNPSKEGVNLNGFEALHLFELGRISIELNQRVMSINDIVEYFSKREPDFMTRYFVYKDLRNRGYVINIGLGSSYFFRLYNRSEKPKDGGAQYYVRPLVEGGSINTEELEALIALAYKSRKELILGMVDANGDVSYLKSSELMINDNKGSE